MAEKADVMRILDITEEEYEEMKKADAEIDRGADPFPLSETQKKVEKKMRQADRVVNPYGKAVKRERKTDTDKETLLNAMFTAILPMCETYEVANAEREFSFTYNGKKYKIVLSCPRS